MVERRKYQRFRVKSKAFAVIKDDPVKPVSIIDVSLGGLGISQFENDILLTKPSKLEILLADCSFFLENLPFTLIPSLRPAQPKPDQIPPARYHGVQFKNLTPSQKHQLQYFIRNHTTGGMMPRFLRKMNRIWRRIWTSTKLEQDRYRIWNSLQRPMPWKLLLLPVPSDISTTTSSSDWPCLLHAHFQFFFSWKIRILFLMQIILNLILNSAVKGGSKMDEKSDLPIPNWIRKPADRKTKLEPPGMCVAMPKAKLKLDQGSI